jgi:hypothetical protein
MDRACSTNGREEECVYDIYGKSRRKETTGKTGKIWLRIGTSGGLL